MVWFQIETFFHKFSIAQFGVFLTFFSFILAELSEVSLLLHIRTACSKGSRFLGKISFFSMLEKVNDRTTDVSTY